jgi:cephalosporin hydroxylase
MFPFWEVVIAPVFEAVAARRVVEIGAWRGETTVLMLERLGPDAELHVIDPVPEFDPAEHERRFPGRYIFHRDTSHNVLPTLEPMEVALVDGDHNWYTVYNELKMLEDGARRSNALLPVLIMHDVGWPYGRRDLYYDPQQVPEEYRQPYRQAGMEPGHERLLPRGGLNPTMFNAETEGGPRNGVMTALDDFLAEYERPVRKLLIPTYFGLAIVADSEWLERRPQLADVFDRLESRDGLQDLLDIAEEMRLRAMIFQHNVYYDRQERLDRATRRYLDVVKSSLVNEHYLEHEVRLEYMARCLTSRRKPEVNLLRDPNRRFQDAYRRLARNRLGPAGPDDEAASSFFPYAAMGKARLEAIERCLDAIRAESIPGDLAECGTGRGGGAIFMRAYLAAYEVAGRQVWVADRFRSSPEPDRAPRLTAEGISGFRADLNLVRDGFARFGLLDERVRFLQGTMASTLPDAPIGRLALLHLGHDLDGDVRTALDNLYDKLVPGGFVLVENHRDSRVRKEVKAFRSDRNISATLQRVDASTVIWRKSASERRGRPTNTPMEPAARAPLAPVAPPDAIDLSVVVVMYNMRREAERTLHALSRAYQEGIDDITYEVIVLENGSDESEKLGEDFVASFGPEFRYVDLGPEAAPSPVGALNRGIKLGRGRAFALMIDGAHILTPGVLHFGLAGLRTYAPAIVATQQWYVGPGQQGDAMDNGYDQAYEDRLLAEIDWPTAGYRLFEIGHFIGDRDWLDGLWESNCMFASRELLQQVGGFDESFTVAGGGYANLELYERLGCTPDVTVATILGEGSFHQVHGGTTTNQPDATERRSRVHGYSEEYADLRGRRFRGPGKPIHYVGRITSLAARRSKPRRLSAEIFAKGADVPSADGRPEHPTPVPDELAWAFTEAVWRSLPWTRTTWLGRRIETAPTDLVAYQEIITDVRPDYILETGTGDGGRSLFLASICELLGHGEVISIGAEHGVELPRHPRLRYVEGRAHAPDVVQQVRRIVDRGRALVILGSCVDRVKTTAEFDAYSSLVPVGSYVVIADTIVNGHPVWPAFGDGPAESVKQVLALHGEFVQDPNMEKYSLTFNPGGFLKRVR